MQLLKLQGELINIERDDSRLTTDIPRYPFIMPVRKRKSISVSGHRKKAKLDTVAESSRRGSIVKRTRLTRIRDLKSTNCPRCQSMLFSSDAKTICCGYTADCPGVLISSPEVPLDWMDMYKTPLFN